MAATAGPRDQQDIVGDSHKPGQRNLGGCRAVAGCDVGDHTYIPPTPKFPGAPLTPCPTDVVRFVLSQGHPPLAYCHSGPTSLETPGLQTLNYGQTVAVGAMTCDSETSGVTCTDTSTGHFFRASRDSYQLG